jgi:hypothetical protein
MMAPKFFSSNRSLAWLGFKLKYVLVTSGILIAVGCKPATNHAVSEHALTVKRLVAEVETMEPIDTLVICPTPFQPALGDWLAYRTKQGRTIKVVAPQKGPNEVLDQIRQVDGPGQLKFVFLIGDVHHKQEIAKLATSLKPPAPRLSLPLADADAQASPKKLTAKMDLAANPLTIPTHYVSAQVNQHFGSEPEISTDHPYSDLTGDGLPDIALGRLPANTIDEVRDYLNRVMHYEQTSTADQHWKRRINFVAGVGGFGKTIDNVLEQITKEVITGMIPSEYEVSMTLGSWRSPFCPDPRKFEQTVIRRFSEGCQFLVYIGHGLPTELGKFRLPDRVTSIFDCQSACEVNCPHGSPIAIFLACYTGAIDHQKDCLTKVLLRQPCGPIAVISGTRVTMPYGMSMLMLEFADKLFDGNQETLGELLQLAKREMVRKHSESPTSFTGETPANESQVDALRRMVQGTGMALSPSPDLLAAECLEHLSMMHLFGDPLLRLQKPGKISVSVPAIAQAGTSLRVVGSSPLAGKLCVELAYPRDRFRKRPHYRGRYRGTDLDFNQYQIAYEDAHDLTCEVCVDQVVAGRFELDLQIPNDVSGECVIRCILSADEGFALGSTRLTIQR